MQYYELSFVITAAQWEWCCCWSFETSSVRAGMPSWRTHSAGKIRLAGSGQLVFWTEVKVCASFGRPFVDLVIIVC